jgi:anti-sigma B factor antagonist
LSEIEASSTFEYTVTRDDDAATLVASGEIDLASSPGLRQELQDLIDAGARRVVVDLSAVTFIDSSGLGVLVGVLNRLDDVGGGTLELCGLTGPVRKVFEITGLHEVFTIRDAPA